MNKTIDILQLLDDLYIDNMAILNAQDAEALEKSHELSSLFNSFSLSNERLKNIISIIEVLKY